MDSRRRTVVFDLDDTLYFERDYVESGRRHVLNIVKQLYPNISLPPLADDDPDFLGSICRATAMPESVKQSLLWAYRLHPPSIELRPGAAELISAIRQRGDAFCILTDGRSATQRLKLAGLRLQPDGLYISEEIGAEKPDPAGYLRIMRDHPADEYLYVADNAAKDFVTARRLGWNTVGISSPRCLRSCPSELPAGHEPSCWLEEFDELATLILG